MDKRCAGAIELLQKMGKACSVKSQCSLVMQEDGSMDMVWRVDHKGQTYGQVITVTPNDIFSTPAIVDGIIEDIGESINRVMRGE